MRTGLTVTGKQLINSGKRDPESEQVRVDVGMTPQLSQRVECTAIILSIHQALPRFI
jgi:hypothetical protein